MSSCDVGLRDLFPLGPGGCLVVGGAGFEAAVDPAGDAQEIRPSTAGFVLILAVPQCSGSGHDPQCPWV